MTQGTIQGKPDEPKFEFRCTACGYGAVVRMAPDTCPMCHGSVWEYTVGSLRR